MFSSASVFANGKTTESIKRTKKQQQVLKMSCFFARMIDWEETLFPGHRWAIFFSAEKWFRDQRFGRSHFFAEIVRRPFLTRLRCRRRYRSTSKTWICKNSFLCRRSQQWRDKNLKKVFFGPIIMSPSWAAALKVLLEKGVCIAQRKHSCFPPSRAWDLISTLP